MEAYKNSTNAGGHRYITDGNRKNARMTNNRVTSEQENEGAGDTGLKPALRYNNPTEERLRFTKQLGVEHVIIHPYDQSYLPDEELPLPTDGPWEFEKLVQVRNEIEDRGLTLGAIENLPREFYDDIMLGREGRSEQFEIVKETIRNLGRAGIRVLGYNWMPNRVWRSSLIRPGRGGVESTAYDHDEMKNAPLTHDREYTEVEMWEYYEEFLQEVLPVAKREGVTLALHPDDPPVEQLGGIPRLFRNFDALERAMELVPSDHHGLELGLGTISEMNHDVETVDLVRHFGNRGEIAYVHFRDVDGTVPSFQEVFIDEGNFDEYEVMKTLIQVGFEGMIIPDHVPQLEGEADWQPSGRGYTIGYIKGMLKALHAK